MERAAFERLALEHLDAVYRLAMHLTRNPEEADDLVQDVYARAFRPKAIATFEDRSGDGSGGMRAWLFTITHNVFYTRIKKKAREPQAVGEFFAESTDGPLPDEPPPAWDRAGFDWEHVDAGLKKAVEDLKPEFREVLLMWGVDGLKYREIAEILGVPIGTVMSRLHRARKTLADRLTSDPEAVENLGLDGLSGKNNGESGVHR
ncbi:MAG: sigma-70 family RNA polymerase sigma factor [Phycisphaerales bacterium]|nr:MAG: sigma-70 family RNA polymerase sigma factor [Phycisphaerales bacterium]